MQRLGTLLELLLSGCVSVQRPVASAAPAFVPEQFFLGRTEGLGTITVVLSAKRSIAVHGVGRMDRDDTIVLDQMVDRTGKPPKKREWRLRNERSGHYEGTLSDAVTPVSGDVAGNCFHVRYGMKSGIAVEQFLYLEPDGRTVLNRMTFRKLGFVVGRLEETIRRID
ncbi:DUF3833 family protein [uncultured Sphingomonas sp.]|uniref:DUF3833 family protein n=1 Tax=uncultured Sphingomonas sp. TaxID=158754 RepID=UPI0026227D0E|nr:DUF3833 family protein [uncultured Sphingomonas sp.]